MDVTMPNLFNALRGRIVSHSPLRRFHAAVLAIVSTVCGSSMVGIAQDRSVALQELIEAEGLLYDGNYMEALRRINISSKSMRAERKSGNSWLGAADPQLLNAVTDILRGQIYLTQGYLSDADAMFKRAEKTLEARRVFWQSQASLPPELGRFLLYQYTLREGLVRLYRGELALTNAWVKSIQGGSEPSIGVARELLEAGVRDVKRVGQSDLHVLALSNDGLELYDLKRHMYQAELRRVQLLLFEGDISRARSAFDELNDQVTGGDNPKDGDLFWQAVFRPDALPAEPTSNADGGSGAAAPAGGAVSSPSGAANAASGGAQANQQMQPEQARTALVGQIRSARGGHTTSAAGRMMMRMGRFYGEMLGVEADLLRKESEFLKDDSLLLISEEKAVMARDIAYEGAWGTPAVLEADIALANSYADSLRISSAATNAAEFLDYKGRRIDVQAERLKSYAQDIAWLANQANEQLGGLGLAKSHPARLMSLVLQDRLIQQGLIPGSKSDAKKAIDEYFETKSRDKAQPAPTKPVVYQKMPRPKAGDPPSLLNTEITQKMGVVCVSDAYVASSDSARGPNNYWELDSEKAVGVVIEVNDQEQYAVVEFPTAEGWENKVVQKSSSTTLYVRRNWWTGEIMDLRSVTTTQDQTLRFSSKGDGLLLTGFEKPPAGNAPPVVNLNSVAEASGTGPSPDPGQGSPVAPAGGAPASPENVAAQPPSSDIPSPAGQASPASVAPPAPALALPIRVRFPISVISLRPPRLGDVVRRGPDWNKGFADGGEGMTGRIILRSSADAELRTKDGYVTVEWDATKRTGRYRWDVRRKFDVWPTAEAFELPQLLAEKAAVAASASEAGEAKEVDATAGSPSNASKRSGIADGKK